jgi:hypothetical protein
MSPEETSFGEPREARREALEAREGSLRRLRSSVVGFLTLGPVRRSSLYEQARRSCPQTRLGAFSDSVPSLCGANVSVGECLARSTGPVPGPRIGSPQKAWRSFYVVTRVPLTKCSTGSRSGRGVAEKPSAYGFAPGPVIASTPNLGRLKVEDRPVRSPAQARRTSTRGPGATARAG